MPWLLKCPKHQQACYWLCMADNKFCCLRVIFYLQYEPKKICPPGGSRQAPLSAGVTFCLQTGVSGALLTLALDPCLICDVSSDEGMAAGSGTSLCSPLSMARHLCEPTGTKGATYRNRQVRPLWPGPSKSFSQDRLRCSWQRVVTFIRWSPHSI